LSCSTRRKIACKDMITPNSTPLNILRFPNQPPTPAASTTPPSPYRTAMFAYAAATSHVTQFTPRALSDQNRKSKIPYAPRRCALLSQLLVRYPPPHSNSPQDLPLSHGGPSHKLPGHHHHNGRDFPAPPRNSGGKVENRESSAFAPHPPRLGILWAGRIAHCASHHPSPRCA
jgi:hypothetical protein